MKTEKLKLSAVVHPEKNVRVHPRKQIEAIIQSLEMFGQTRPAVVDENNVILVGNGMIQAMEEMGMEHVYVYRKTGLSDADKKKLMLVDNRLYYLGRDDTEVQFDLLREIIGNKDDLNIPGFDKSVLESLVANAVDATEMIKNYGGIPEDKKKFLESREAPDINKEGDSGGKEIRCPHCGGMFWVPS